jgi:hypothetical protein
MWIALVPAALAGAAAIYNLIVEGPLSPGAAAGVAIAGLGKPAPRCSTTENRSWRY